MRERWRDKSSETHDRGKQEEVKNNSMHEGAMTWLRRRRDTQWRKTRRAMKEWNATKEQAMIWFSSSTHTSSTQPTCGYHKPDTTHINTTHIKERERDTMHDSHTLTIKLYNTQKKRTENALERMDRMTRIKFICGLQHIQTHQQHISMKKKKEHTY